MGGSKVARSLAKVARLGRPPRACSCGERGRWLKPADVSHKTSCLPNEKGVNVLSQVPEASLQASLIGDGLANSETFQRAFT